MQDLRKMEIGVMFWAGRDPHETLREVKSAGVRCGQLGIPGGYALKGAAQAWKRALADEDFRLVTVFCALLLGHLLYDFHWQGPFIADNKGKRPFLLVVHALTWTLLLVAVLWWFGVLSWWHPVFLFLSHCATDYWKSHQPRTPDAFWYIYIDQSIHLLTLVIVAL